MARELHISGARLAEYQLGGLSSGVRREVESHASTCVVCAGAIKRCEMAHRAYAAADLAVSDVDRQRHIRAALAGATEESEATPSVFSFTRVRFFAIALTVALIAFVAMRQLESSELQSPIVVAGELGVGAERFAKGDSVEAEAAIVVPTSVAEVELEIPGGARLRGIRGAKFAVRQKGARIDLQTGRVALRVKSRPKDRPLEVETTEAIVRVVGTEFEVSRVDEGTARTSVSVSHGIVDVIRRDDKSVTRLTAGQSMEIASAAPIPAPAPPPVAELPPPAPRGPDASIASIRSNIRAGQLAKATAMLKNARADQARARQDLPELAIVEAELYLARKRFRNAIGAYLTVVKRYPKTEQSEAALFAAAQVALDHPEAGFQGQPLIKSYLSKHPRGRFSEEARQMLEAIGQHRR